MRNVFVLGAGCDLCSAANPALCCHTAPRSCRSMGIISSFNPTPKPIFRGQNSDFWFGKEHLLMGSQPCRGVMLAGGHQEASPAWDLPALWMQPCPCGSFGRVYKVIISSKCFCQGFSISVHLTLNS